MWPTLFQYIQSLSEVALHQQAVDAFNFAFAKLVKVGTLKESLTEAALKAAYSLSKLKEQNVFNKEKVRFVSPSLLLFSFLYPVLLED